MKEGGKHISNIKIQRFKKLVVIDFVDRKFRDFRFTCHVFWSGTVASTGWFSRRRTEAPGGSLVEQIENKRVAEMR